MNKIEEKLKADYKYKDLNYSVEQLQGMITIENPSGTSLMRMTATNSDAQLAQILQMRRQMLLQSVFQRLW